MTKPYKPKLYVGGKIKHNDFRYPTIMGLEPYVREYRPSNALTLDDNLKHFFASNTEIENEPYQYMGPFPVCWIKAREEAEAAAKNGEAPGKTLSRKDVFNICQKGIELCDIFIAHFESVDDLTAYATLAEIGEAFSLGKVIMLSGHYDDRLWFVWKMAHYTFINRTFADVFPEMVQISIDITNDNA